MVGKQTWLAIGLALSLLLAPNGASADLIPSADPADPRLAVLKRLSPADLLRQAKPEERYSAAYLANPPDPKLKFRHKAVSANYPPSAQVWTTPHLVKATSLPAGIAAVCQVETATMVADEAKPLKLRLVNWRGVEYLPLVKKPGKATPSCARQDFDLFFGAADPGEAARAMDMFYRLKSMPPRTRASHGVFICPPHQDGCDALDVFDAPTGVTPCRDMPDFYGQEIPKELEAKADCLVVNLRGAMIWLQEEADGLHFVYELPDYVI